MEHTINIYCDESCHLLNDHQKSMVLGALWSFALKTSEHNAAIAEMKAKHGLSRFFEIKWSKVSASKLAFYRDLVDYFFDAPTIGVRVWVIPDKSILKHEEFQQSHDDWYYKMYFYLIRNLINPEKKYRIYLDIKDTRSRQKLRELEKVVANANYDFSREIIQRVQHVHSHDIGLMQLADLLIGAVSYSARGLTTSPGKQELIAHIRQRSGLSLTRNTLPSVRKFNICFWQPNNGGIENA
ncbi:MAG: DUF3800 domain-containing protein [Candidatus Marinimicrobia bacterium]|nr:DUF3800 domain-containing protein [Candidatus Neomarinimicrobiota bacterium]